MNFKIDVRKKHDMTFTFLYLSVSSIVSFVHCITFCSMAYLVYESRTNRLRGQVRYIRLFLFTRIVFSCYGVDQNPLTNHALYFWDTH